MRGKRSLYEYQSPGETRRGSGHISHGDTKRSECLWLRKLPTFGRLCRARNARGEGMSRWTGFRICSTVRTARQSVRASGHRLSPSCQSTRFKPVMPCSAPRPLRIETAKKGTCSCLLLVSWASCVVSGISNPVSVSPRYFSRALSMFGSQVSSVASCLKDVTALVLVPRSE